MHQCTITHSSRNAPLPAAAAAVLVGLSCVVALAYNLVHNLVIHVFSSVTTTVLGEVKIVGILLLSSLFLGAARACTLSILLPPPMHPEHSPPSLSGTTTLPEP
jgi:hypothetical protein